MSEQLAWGEDVPKVKYVRATERALYEYSALKEALINEKELEKLGLGNLYPSMTASYEESIRGSGISKPTESFGSKRAEKDMKVKMIDRALNILSPNERELIHVKYLSSFQPSDIHTYLQLGWTERTYYRVKDRALRKIATALNII